MVGRRVRRGREEGVVLRWEPLAVHPSSCDTLVELNDGRKGYYASEDLKPADGRGPLPSRRWKLEGERRVTLVRLEAILGHHVREFRKPWPCMEFAKVWLGNSLLRAIESVKADEERYGKH